MGDFELDRVFVKNHTANRVPGHSLFQTSCKSRCSAYYACGRKLRKGVGRLNLCSVSSGRSSFGVTFPTVHRSRAIRFEGNLTLLTAISTSRFVHLFSVSQPFHLLLLLPLFSKNRCCTVSLCGNVLLKPVRPSLQSSLPFPLLRLDSSPELLYGRIIHRAG
jgi:hypothetical protein